MISNLYYDIIKVLGFLSKTIYEFPKIITNFDVIVFSRVSFAPLFQKWMWILSQ